VRENRPLIEVVKNLAKDSIKKGEVDWQTLTDPKNYLGETKKLISQVLEQVKRIT
jgi:hypothetical protein